MVWSTAQIKDTLEYKAAKDSVDAVDYALIEFTEKDHAAAVDSYLDTAVEADKFGCGRRPGRGLPPRAAAPPGGAAKSGCGSRLVCELHRRAESELVPEEVLLRSMFE